MPIPVTCECGRQLLAKDEFAGRHTQCPDCGRDLVIPDSPNANQEAPAPPRAPLATEADWEPGPGKGEPRTSGQAIASLILGVLSFFFCFVAGIPAVIFGFLGLSEINKSKGQLRGKGLATTGVVLGFIGSFFSIIGILIALLLPAVQAAREAARRTQCTNNLKQIGLAMHNFHDTEGHLPPQAITDDEGQPLLSWRVAILPYIERQELYEHFNLDEPWDSPNNLALISEMPNTYVCPSSPNAEQGGGGVTSYQVLVGPGTLFETGQGDIGFMDVTDGTSNTLMVVETTGGGVPWTKPEDIPFDPSQVGAPIGSSYHPGGFNALFGDGSVRFISSAINPSTLPALGTRNGGEVVQPF